VAQTSYHPYLANPNPRDTPLEFAAPLTNQTNIRGVRPLNSFIFLKGLAMPHSVNTSISTATGPKMSRPSSTSTYSASNANANAFPRQAGVTTLLAPEPDNTQLTSPSQLSFTSSPRSVHDAPAFDESRLQPASANTARPYSRQRAQYYEEQFSYKEGTTSNARDRVTKDAPIVAELRTNVIVGC
jgi:hypothetical protein